MAPSGMRDIEEGALVPFHVQMAGPRFRDQHRHDVGNSRPA